MNVLIEPDSIDLVTVDELKLLLAVTPGDTTKDATLALINTEMSAAVARLVNRVFGYQKVTETFFEIEAGTKELFFSQWPVKFSDIEVLTLNGVDILLDTNWTLEEKTGTLYGDFAGVVDSIYSGGYHLPDEAPYDLKAAVTAVSREAYTSSQRPPSLTGVRMIAHKQARVQYHSPTQSGSTTATSGVSTQTWNSVKNVLEHYYRHWI
jgi:hypothetical protein